MNPLNGGAPAQQRNNKGDGALLTVSHVSKNNFLIWLDPVECCRLELSASGRFVAGSTPPVTATAPSVPLFYHVQDALRPQDLLELGVTTWPCRRE